jgi:MFS family permease
MIGRRFTEVLHDPTWFRFISFSLILFFLLLGDAVLSFWVPNLLEEVLGNPLLMGLTMSFSSLVGFIMDLIFPGLIKNVSVKRMIGFAAAISILFSLSLLITLKLPLLLIILFAMALWGVYYEVFSFAEQQFVADSMPMKLRTGGWAIFGVFKNLAYFLGPLIGALVIVKGEWMNAALAIFFTLIGAGILLFFRNHHERPFSFDLKEVNILAEISHWKVLLKYVWPVVVLSLTLGIIDSTFWTTGTVLTEKLTRESAYGSFFLPLYQLPSLFVGFVMARFSVYEGKKKWAILFMLFGGITLMGVGVAPSLILILLSVFVSSILTSICFPLTNAVYTDLVARMGRERKHLIGLSSSSVSLAYIIGPTIAGLITSLVGDKMTFTVIGGAGAFIAIFLLLVTPKKIRLPEGEISAWGKVEV